MKIEQAKIQNICKIKANKSIIYLHKIDTKSSGSLYKKSNKIGIQFNK